VGGGIAGLFATGSMARDAKAAQPKAREDRLPREVWIASISQSRMETDRFDQMIQAMLRRMEETLPYEPDIICLPEVFPFANLRGGRPSPAEVAEEPIGAVSQPFSDFAKSHNCNVVCPIYTKENGFCYNAAIFIDRQGRAIGEYRKMHPTEGEIENGIMPGPLDTPVCRTDFGIVGAQICFDIEWSDGWEKLGQAGAEIVFWPSAFGGGAMVNAKAWLHKYCVVSSTRKGTSKICDVSGEEVARTGQWDRWVCASVNLEKAFLHTWPYCRRFPEIRAKYGRRIRIQTFHEEEWSILESRCPELKIADVMQEFELKTHRELIRDSQAAQEQARRQMPAG
jgi:predicted amidohydrolase